METVAITGGCGVVGRFVARRLCENANVEEIRIIDRSAERPESHPKIRYIQLDLTGNDADLDRALQGVTAVVHTAKADLPLIYQSKEDLTQMWMDNVDATERLIERMLAKKIRRLVYVGDAYSALPVDDNFGLSEDIHRGLPSSFLLGEWGESRTRAELLARKAAEKDNSLDAIFLRPTWVYSEIPSSFWKGLKRLVDSDQLPYTPGPRRGLHQFMYAGNLAKTIEDCVFFLKADPQKYSNELVYLTDNTYVASFIDFLKERTGGEHLSQETPFWTAFFRTLYPHLSRACGMPQEGRLHFHTWRAIFEKVIGFCDKKARLLLNFKPETPPAVAMARSLEMFKEKAIIVDLPIHKKLGVQRSLRRGAYA
ncbi:unnamed protein product, partial [Mesorhabditis spiculigera]